MSTSAGGDFDVVGCGNPFGSEKSVCHCAVRAGSRQGLCGATGFHARGSPLLCDPARPVCRTGLQALRTGHSPIGGGAPRGGLKVVRSAIYMAALVATKHYPMLRDQYQKLIAAEKSKTLSLVACLRKLLVMLNGILRTRPHSE